MIDILTKYGYVYYGFCNCDGHRTNKYQRKGFKIKWRTRKDLFRVISNGGAIVGWTNISQAENILKEIHSNVAV